MDDSDADWDASKRINPFSSISQHWDELNKASSTPQKPHSISARIAVTNQQVEVNSVYLQPELFHHFSYILNLARDCEPRVKNICTSMAATKLLYRDAFIRIRYVGKMNDNIPVQKTIKYGKTILSSDQVEWETSPLICFQNDLSLGVAIQLLRGVEKGPKILITSDSIAKDCDRKADDIILVDQDHFLKELTQCLEGPLCEMLNKWIKNVETLTPTKKNQWVMEEIKTIREEMAFQEISRNPQSPGIANFVPCDIKNHLLGRDDVNSFGMWYNSSFIVFTKKDQTSQIA
uniref:Uncharacterized protein LOC111115457 n=1 Tax=Crassostrea virginica TaxID=6565 RepID=A0A8B8C2K4_CRAVI|nr:uncharacterized protein LOC111115457 [Crassostrea virginica]